MVLRNCLIYLLEFDYYMIEQTDNILFFELKTHDFVELFEGKLITKNKTLVLTYEILTVKNKTLI